MPQIQRENILKRPIYGYMVVWLYGWSRFDPFVFVKSFVFLLLSNKASSGPIKGLTALSFCLGWPRQPSWNTSINFRKSFLYRVPCKHERIRNCSTIVSHSLAANLSYIQTRTMNSSRKIMCPWDTCLGVMLLPWTKWRKKWCCKHKSLYSCPYCEKEKRAVRYTFLSCYDLVGYLWFFF